MILLKTIVASKVINSDPDYHAGKVPDFQLILEIPDVISISQQTKLWNVMSDICLPSFHEEPHCLGRKYLGLFAQILTVFLHTELHSHSCIILIHGGLHINTFRLLRCRIDA